MVELPIKVRYEIKSSSARGRPPLKETSEEILEYIQKDFKKRYEREQRLFVTFLRNVYKSAYISNNINVQELSEEWKTRKEAEGASTKGMVYTGKMTRSSNFKLKNNVLTIGDKAALHEFGVEAHLPVRDVVRQSINAYFGNNDRNVRTTED